MCIGRNIADIGTDHAYLPCYMAENNLCDFALACDVAEMPLESARTHILQSGFSNKITAVLSDGLQNVSRGNLTDVVMAGMGGELIASIIDKCLWAKDKENPVNFILQPMTKWDVLRKWLYDNGFAVNDEKACKEGRFVYSVMSVKFIGRTPEYKCDLEYLYFGFVKYNSEDEKEYIQRQISRLETAGNGMLGTDGKREKGREMLELAKSVREKYNIK